MKNANLHFKSIKGELFGEQVSLSSIANHFGTPCYVYSKAALLEAWQAFATPLKKVPHHIHYAVKANSNLAILKILNDQGAGFEIVSEGELERVLKIGGQPQRIVFSGVGKSTRELQRAIQAGVGCINIETEGELLRINDIAGQLQSKATIAIRINPDVSANSHPYISTGLNENKFGISLRHVKSIFKKSAELPHVSLQGIAFHIGSQITTLSPFMEALKKVLSLVDELSEIGIPLKHLNIGGGLGVCYPHETPPTPSEYIQAILAELRDYSLELHLEPGRAIVAEAGVLLTRVEYLKDQFAIVDAGMNDLLRPALYGAIQDIVPVIPHMLGERRLYDIVGPVCETSDFLGKKRDLCLKPGDLLAILSTGAYGFSMSSNYNSRPRACEVMIDNDHYQVIREREKLSDLFAPEVILRSHDP